MKIKAYVVKEAKKDLVPFEYESKEVNPLSVEVKITDCGICHSDIHLIDGDWGNHFPLVPGHEIVGKITKIGKDVKTLKIGERVGIGWQCGSCMICDLCVGGEEHLCAKQE